jgi:hypothetical protein
MTKSFLRGVAARRQLPVASEAGRGSDLHEEDWQVSERNDWVLDVLVAPYGGPYGGRDAQGEFFTPETDLWLERIQRRPVVYYHGLDERQPQVIGEELGWERRADGVWFKVALDRTSRLARRVWEAARKGMARASSGAIGHLVRVAGDGRILTWPIGEISLLDVGRHAPANPYAVALVHAKALFAAAGLPGAEAFEAEAESGRTPDDVEDDGDGSAGGSPTPPPALRAPSPFKGEGRGGGWTPSNPNAPQVTITMKEFVT